MEHYLITIDSGTTNTRVALWNQKKACVDIYKSEIGVRVTAVEGNNKRLAGAIREGIQTLLNRNNLTIHQIASVYASGMITSNVGLTEVPHIEAPAGLEDFAAAVRAVLIPEVFELPIHFIPGLKNSNVVDMDTLESMDIMRGEETEALALLSIITVKGAVLLALPGSHNKFVTTDRSGRLTGCLTTLSGELLSAITNHTIIADAVNHSFASAHYNWEMVLKGFKTARDTSLTRAVFTTRILNQCLSASPKDCAGYLLGAVLSSDISAVKKSSALMLSPDMQVVVAGKEPLRSALTRLFEEDGSFSDVSGYDSGELLLSGYGALLIAVYNGDF